MSVVDLMAWKHVFFYWPDYSKYRAEGLAPRSALARAKIDYQRAIKATRWEEPTPERPWWWAESISKPVAMFESREEARDAGNAAVKRGRTFYTGVYVMRHQTVNGVPVGEYRDEGFTKVETHISTGTKSGAKA